MTDKRDDQALKAFTGLEGGLVASGSTCGVVSAGAFGIAMMHDDLLQKHGTVAEIKCWIAPGNTYDGLKTIMAHLYAGKEAASISTNQ